MKTNIQKILVISLAVLISLTTVPGCKKDSNSDDIIAIAEDAYIFGLPLVLMDITRRQATNTTTICNYTTICSKAPMNHFNFAPIFPNSDFQDIVRPNNDTYYSVAWLDLRQEPIVLSLPNTGGRYHMMQIMDAYTNVFAAPGTRTTGNGGGEFLISGPGWSGNVPAGMIEYKSTTNYVWILGRTQVNSQEDGQQVVVPIMKQYKLTPLSGMQTPPADIDPTVPTADPNKVVDNMSIDDFFNYLNQLLVINPPTVADQQMMKRIAKIGITPGGTFDLGKFSNKEQESLRKVPQTVLAKLLAEGQTMSVVNGWSSMVGTGSYGINYLFRAFVARFGLGANLPEDAMYYSCMVDENGDDFDGSKQYVLRFEAGKTPPVQAFWSVTMYDSDGYLVANELHRYAIGDRSGLVENPDGSISIYIQHTNPGAGKVSNWLPAPADNFNLMLRAYYPKQEILNLSWKVPAVKIQD
ncbi:MAG: DUF1254 domain-containing protein [Bacteroidales bacterium]|nr:DUF1254 domain-containing protein [Bacteroidales bacterium]